MLTTYQVFILCCFLAVALAVEGGYQAWNDRRGAAAQHLLRRLRAISAVAASPDLGKALKARNRQNLSRFELFLLGLPRLRHLDRLLVQAAYPHSLSHFAVVCLLAGGAGMLAGTLLRWPPLLVLAAGAIGLAWPVLRLLQARRRRLELFEQHLPEALDLMARALRAGHAFSSAIEMVASEANEPAASEFRTTFEEINFGIALNDALLHLASRVASTDLRYFVIAVLLQRETGGNLAELLDNLSRLMRARFKLIGSVRVLSAEGRLSAWVLSLLPFVAATLLNAINPGFMRVLWTDPLGLRLLWTGLAMTAIGILWMWQMVRIRV